MSNPFFNNCGPLQYSDIIKILKIKGDDQIKDQKISSLYLVVVKKKYLHL